MQGNARLPLLPKSNASATRTAVSAAPLLPARHLRCQPLAIAVTLAEGEMQPVLPAHPAAAPSAANRGTFAICQGSLPSSEKGAAQQPQPAVLWPKDPVAYLPEEHGGELTLGGPPLVGQEPAIGCPLAWPCQAAPKAFWEPNTPAECSMAHSVNPRTALNHSNVSS
uniref:Uncharacterized protein n=1 Tax=Sphaerodactylus townsendi TaxID=933632 RepID=A0ACB8EP54_9SAUR